MARASKKQELKSYIEYDLIFSHFKTSLQVAKFKRNRRDSQQRTIVKAHLLMDCFKLFLFDHVDVSRYVYRITYRPRSVHLSDHIWNDIVNTTTIYNDDEFLATFRVTRGTFSRLLDLIKDSPHLQGRNPQKQSQHFSPHLHLLAALKFFGAEGNHGSPIRLRDNLGIAKGSVMNYVARCVNAILTLHDKCFFGHLHQRDKKLPHGSSPSMILRIALGLLMELT
jgi:hypothetical protein